MKKVMNDLAVATLLSTMKPQAEVEIFDASQCLVPVGDPVSSATGILHTVDELLHDYKYERIVRAKVYRTEIKDNHLFLLIDTIHETY